MAADDGHCPLRMPTRADRGLTEVCWDVRPSLGFPGALCGRKRYFSVRPLDWHMRTPDVVKDAAVFFGRRSTPNDPSTEHPVGSGFVAAIDDGETLFPYLVTAHHVSEKLNEYGYQPIVRINGKRQRVRTRPKLPSAKFDGRFPMDSPSGQLRRLGGGDFYRL
jgi:hypothetical protein